MIRSRTVNTIHELLAQGKSVQDIAITLGIARNTVRKYMRHPELCAMLSIALRGTLDLHWVIQQIIEDLPMCRMNPRRNHPNAYQLLLQEPPSSPGSACQTPEALASP